MGIGYSRFISLCDFIFRVNREYLGGSRGFVGGLVGIVDGSSRVI